MSSEGRERRETEPVPNQPVRTIRSFRVEVVGGPAAGTVAVSRDGRLRIGAAPGNDLVIDDARVSWHHVELESAAGGVRLRDLGSTNGTEVDGYRIHDLHLPREARIRIGDSELSYAEEGFEPDLPVSEATRFGRAIGHSRPMRRVFAVLEKVAPTDATVLIEGESGTGKEILARAIHDHSARSRGPFVVFDCGAVAPTLLESELFGHERGAFTGANRERPGVMEAGHRGTVFLDEIGEMPIELQTRLLGVLERRTTRRVGSTTDRPVDVRFVAATNRDLRQQVNEGHFRADLWHRLAVVRLVVPPLRARPEDVVPIAREILADLGKRYRREVTWSDDDLQALARQRWTGNVRELRNHLEAALALAGDEDVDFGRPSASLSSAPDLGEIDLAGTFHDAKARLGGVFERAYLLALLKRHPGNLSAAAREADLSRMHLRRLLKRHGLAKDAPDADGED